MWEGGLFPLLHQWAHPPNLMQNAKVLNPSFPSQLPMCMHYTRVMSLQCPIVTLMHAFIKGGVLCYS
ncbi:unnamed protein product [Cuscuta campestris]|uniref:Uncharacterized protein n=1 Tax=Cuscuta campestris TaxID=132261 RepID=A0A484M819_9ASTE|nr:unnamed protein product [Cuscuta campestris]